MPRPLPVVDPKAVRAAARPRRRARPLPVGVYTDPAVFALERDHLFARSFVPLAREDDVALPGSFVRVVGPWDVVVVRGEDLAVRAFFDACRHRGAPLVGLGAARGRTTRFTCPYHGWTYDTSGALVGTGRVPCPVALGRATDGGAGLLELDVHVEAGIVFGRAAGPAPFPAPPRWLEAASAELLRPAHASTTTTRANWKLVVENFQESAHFPSVHPGLEARTPARTSSSHTDDDAWLEGTMDLAPGAETVSPSGRRDGRPFVAAPADRGAVHDALGFPLLLVSLQPDYLLTYRLAPLAADATSVEFTLLVHPEAAAWPAERHAELVAFWTRTNDEDRAIVEAQQRALATPGLAFAPFAANEDGVHAFQRRLARAYADATRRAVRRAPRGSAR